MRFLLSCVAAICCLVSWAADDYLHIRTSDGWKVLDISQVDRLTFSNGTMVATDKENKTLLTVPTTDLKAMVVDNDVNPTPTGIEEVTAKEVKASFTYDASTKSVTMLEDAPFEVYAITGLTLCVIPNAKAGEVIDLKDIHPGVIILKSGQYSLKVVVL